MLALITATRNSVATLPDAMASIEGVRDRVKSFFIDGGSNDGTLELVQSHVRESENSVLLCQDGLGLYQALNQGIQAAMGDPDVTHIGMLHSDDRVIPAVFKRYLSVIENDPAAVFYSGIEFHDPSGARVRTWESSKFSRFKLNTGWMPIAHSLCRKTPLFRLGGYYLLLQLSDSSFSRLALSVRTHFYWTNSSPPFYLFTDQSSQQTF